jgi:hypothetical protein
VLAACNRGNVSSWWREIVRIQDGVDGPWDGWFGDCVLKKGGGLVGYVLLD